MIRDEIRSPLRSPMRRAFGQSVGALFALAALNALAAFSVRRVRAGYSGPSLRVRRSSDNVEADIGWTSGDEIDSVALLAHTGANSGFVVTWYDQSGNARHLTQATAASQPRIVNAGTRETAGGRQAIVFDQIDDTLIATSWATVAHPFTRNAVIRQNATINLGHIMNSATASNVADFNNAAGTLNMFAGTVGANVAVAANERYIYTAGYNGASSTLTKNGTVTGPFNTGTAPLEGITIGSAVGSLYSGTTFQEVLIFGSALATAERNTLERNQGAYYGITVA